MEWGAAGIFWCGASDLLVEWGAAAIFWGKGKASDLWVEWGAAGIFEARLLISW